MRVRFSQVVIVAVLALVGAGLAHADTFNFFGTTSGGSSVNGTAVISGSAGSNIITITLTNNIANIVDAGQGISGFSFQVTNSSGTVINITPVSISSQSGREVLVGTGGVITEVGGTTAADTSGWGLTTQNPAYVNALGFTGPSGTKPPDEEILGSLTNGAYSLANGSIATNTPHNPFVVQTLNLTLTLGINLPAGFQFTNAIMYFGTNADTLPPPPQVPEPGTLTLFGSGLVILGRIVRRRLSA
jgi:hypothetical protein